MDVMFLVPPNFNFPMQLVPVFEWEKVDDPSNSASPPAAPPSCDGTDTGFADTAPADTSSPEMRLVFKGYEWRAVAERNIYPRADWESIYRSEADARDEERDPHQRDAVHRPVVPKPPHIGTDPHLLDPSISKPEPSES
ncbi:MAG TPA: hypothetical protein VFK10_21630 [Burkholderiaceae bacterium]|nr:hypothetical protein [Burkholderiaceae bacterium]